MLKICATREIGVTDVARDVARGLPHLRKSRKAALRHGAPPAGINMGSQKNAEGAEHRQM